MVGIRTFQLRLRRMTRAVHFPSSICMMHRALLQEEINGVLCLVSGTPRSIRLSPVVIIQVSIRCLQTQAGWLGGRLAHTRMPLDIAIGQRDRDGIGIVLLMIHCLI